jgi:hypothetical protein
MGEWMYRSIFSRPRHQLEVSGKLHAPSALPPGERALCTHWIGGSVGPRASLDAAEKILDHTGTRNSEPSVFQPVASRYTDYTIPGTK